MDLFPVDGDDDALDAVAGAESAGQGHLFIQPVLGEDLMSVCRRETMSREPFKWQELPMQMVTVIGMVPPLVFADRLTIIADGRGFVHRKE